MSNRPRNTYHVGDVVRCASYDVDTEEESFTDAITGDAIDPDEVNLTVRPPHSDIITYTYGTDEEVVRNDTGQYYVDVSVDEAGTWYYSWWSTGDGQTADEQSFVVKARRAM